MPPNPFKFLKNLELTPQQRRDLKKKLEKRKRDLAVAMNALESAINLLRGAISQDPLPKKRRAKKKTGR